MNEQKKQWQKPVLVVIGRGRPEERVLENCKYTGRGFGPLSTNNCKNANGPGDCSAIGNS
jgi:hypothetical protein